MTFAESEKQGTVGRAASLKGHANLGRSGWRYSGFDGAYKERETRSYFSQTDRSFWQPPAGQTHCEAPMPQRYDSRPTVTRSIARGSKTYRT